MPPKTSHGKFTASEQLGPSKPGTDAAGRTFQPSRPPGSLQREAIEERVKWARLQFRQRPRMPMGGPDGILVLLRKRFGIGLDIETIAKIKREINEELAGLPPNVPAGVEAAPAPVVPLVKVTAEITPHPPKDPSADIETAVQLILESVPALRTFTISVDDRGEASVEYTVREVRVVESAGKLTVRR